MHMTMDKLSIKGHHYNPNVVDRVGSSYYDNDECEDNYIQIAPDASNSDVVIVGYFSGCELVHIEAVAATSLANLEAWINQSLVGI